MTKCLNHILWMGFLAVVAVCLLLGQTAFTQSRRETIRIATVEYPPSFYPDGTGAAADMLTELLDQMGYDTAIEIYPLGRTLLMVNTGDIACAFLFPQTDSNTTVPIKVYYSSTVFVYKASRFPKGLTFNSLSDLKGYTIGALTNSKWSIRLFQENAGLKLDFAPKNDLNLQKLYYERIDLLPLSHLIALPLIESVFPNEKDEFGFTEPFGIKPVCLIFSKTYPGNPALIEKIKASMETMDIRTLLQKHFGKFFPGGIIPGYLISGEIPP